jgi:hypothetical protein
VHLFMMTLSSPRMGYSLFGVRLWQISSKGLNDSVLDFCLSSIGNRKKSLEKTACFFFLFFNVV